MTYLPPTSQLPISVSFLLFEPILSSVKRRLNDMGRARGILVRLVRQPFRDRFLELYVREMHDLAISKALRADERDRRHLVAMHGIDPFDFDLLVSRLKDGCVGPGTSIVPSARRTLDTGDAWMRSPLHKDGNPQPVTVVFAEDRERLQADRCSPVEINDWSTNGSERLSRVLEGLRIEP